MKNCSFALINLTIVPPPTHSQPPAAVPHSSHDHDVADVVNVTTDAKREDPKPGGAVAGNCVGANHGVEGAGQTGGMAGVGSGRGYGEALECSMELKAQARERHGDVSGSGRRGGGA